MSRQFGIGQQPLSVPALEDRIRALEMRLALLSEAVGVMAAGLEGTPLDEPGDEAMARAARRAHELAINARTRS
ncbi:hypothetical protein [Actinomadura gamaensis]|uniref:Uncharacterized protein n=1 Tax=Actinomadura gamaensis TaxID=1763541 RepID=A0ABV9U174_9ACTN